MKEALTFWRTLTRRDRLEVIAGSIAGLALVAIGVIAALIIL